MKILIVNRALGTLFGGGESFDLNAARHLSRRGHDVTLLTAKPLWGAATNHFADMNVVYLPCPALRNWAYAAERFNGKLSAAFYHLDLAMFEQAAFRWIRRWPRDELHVVQCCGLFRLPRKLTVRLQLPTVSWLPGPPSGVAKKGILSLIKHKHFSLFTHGSPEWSLNQMGLKRDDDFSIIEPGVELALAKHSGEARARVRAQLGLGDGNLLGLTTARLVPVKNHFLLLDGIARAKRRGVIWHWAIIGDGPLGEALRQQVDELNITSQIHFLGHQSPEDVHRWLNGADLFALTSTYESFSIATLEAMAHQLPLVATEVGYLQYLVRDAGAGLVVPSNHADAVASALVEMAAPETRWDYGQHGRKFVSQLDWPLVAEKLESLYKKVVAGRVV